MTLTAKDTVKIGVILPLSGNNAGLGRPQLSAIKLFEKECERTDYKHNYKLIIEDNQLTARASAEAVNKLINIDHVDGIVSLFCDAGHVLAPRMRAAKIPHVNCVCSDDSVAEGQFNFVHWPYPEKECKAFADLIEKIGGKRIAILSAQQPGCLALTKATEAELKKRGITVTTVQKFIPGERDFRITLMKIRETNPDTLIPFAFTPEMEIILRQAKQLDFRPKITTLELFDFVADLSDAEGLYYVSGGAATEEFNKNLIEVSGQGSSYGVPTIYDGLNLIRSAYETMDKPDRVAAAKWISQAQDFPSAMGKITVNKSGRIDSELGFYRVVKGKPTPVKFEDIK